MQAIGCAAAVLALACGMLWSGRAAAGQTQSAPAHRAQKVALICPEERGGQSDDVAAILTAGLSDSKDFALVERQAVKNVLEEQKLQPLTDPSGAIKIGQLVGADVIVFCQSVKDSKPELMRVRIVETASGVILLDELQEIKSLTKEPEAFLPVVEATVKKAAVPVPDRKLIGLINVSSEEPGKSLDPLTTSLDVLLRSDLAQAPSVVVLEREQLQHLVGEQALSGLETKLRASTRLLEVKVKRAAGEGMKDKLDITVRITEMAGGKTRIQALSAPQHDVAALRQQLVAAMLKELDAPIPPGAAGDVKTEAAAFHERAKLLLIHGYAKEALRLTETAYALDRQDAYFDTLAQCCANIFNGFDPSVGIHYAWIYPHVATLEQLDAALLLAQVHLDESHRLAASIPADMKNPEGLHWGPTSTNFYNLSPMFPLPNPPQNAEQKVLNELMDMSREEYRLWFDVYRAHQWSVEEFDQTTIKLSPFLARDGAEYCKLAQAAYEEFESEETTGLRKKTRAHPAYPDLSEMFAMLFSSGHLGNVKAGDVEPLLHWLTEQRDPMLREQGWNALARFSGEHGKAAAVHALDALFREKPLGEFTPDCILPPNFDYYSLQIMAQNGELESYTSGLLDGLEKSGDLLPLLRWTRETCELLHLPPKDDLALSLRMQKFLNSKPVPAEYADHLRIVLANLSDRIQICRQRLGLLDGKGNPWDGLAAREIKVQATPSDAPRLLWVSVDRTRKEPDLLMLWRSDPVNENNGVADFILVVGRMPLEGGKITEIARGRFSGPVYRFYGDLRGFRITSVLPTPSGIIISDFRRGILVVRDRTITALTEKEGLASNQIWSLAWAGNKLYAGADDGFMTVDPETGHCKILASAKALVSSSNPLDGGVSYRVANILPSPDGKSLWLSVGSDRTRLGLWRYDLATGVYEHIVHNYDNDIQDQNYDTGPSVTWHDGKLLVIGPAAGRYGRTGLFDPDTGECVKTFYGQRMYDADVADYFPDERGAQKVWKPVAYTPQHRAALTSIGFITTEGDAVDPVRDKGAYHDWHIEGSLDVAANQVSVRRSRIATPDMFRNWNMIEEVGEGFVAATYGDSIDRPVLWYFTPNKPVAAGAPAVP